MPALYIEPELVFRSVLPFAAAHIFAIVLIYFTLVRQRLGQSYPYFATFIVCFILFLCSPLIKVTAPESVVFSYEIIKNILLFSIGFPTLICGIYMLAKHNLPQRTVVILYGLGIIWSLYYLVIRTKFLFVKNDGFQFLKNEYFTIDAAFYSQSVLLIITVLLPSIYLLKLKPECITRINIYGLLLLCLSLLIGIFFRHWEVMNAGCSLTALLWGWAIFNDITSNNKKIAQHYKHEKALAKAQYASAGEMSFSDHYPTELNVAYPFKEREALIESVRTSSQGLIVTQVNDLIEGLKSFTQNKQEIMRVRYREVLFMLFDTAIYIGANAEELTKRLALKGNEIHQTHKALNLSQLLVDECIYLCQAIQKITQVNPDLKSVDNAKAYLLANYFNDINISDVVTAVGLSRSHLMRTFKQAENQTINQYLNDIRIEKAKTLLLSKSVTETALDVGFNNSNYFSTVFKKQVGLSPKEYQQQAKHQPTN